MPGHAASPPSGSAAPRSGRCYSGDDELTGTVSGYLADGLRSGCGARTISPNGCVFHLVLGSPLVVIASADAVSLLIDVGGDHCRGISG